MILQCHKIESPSDDSGRFVHVLIELLPWHTTEEKDRGSEGRSRLKGVDSG